MERVEYPSEFRRSALPLVALILILGVIAVAFAIPVITGHSPLPAEEPFQGIIFAVVCGLVTCAILETAKRLLYIRGRFQLRATRTWLAERVGVKRSAGAFSELRALLASPPAYAMSGVAVRLSSDDRRRRSNRQTLISFDQPIERLAAQVADVLDLVLRRPDEYPYLYYAMVGADEALGVAISEKPIDPTEAALGNPTVETFFPKGWKWSASSGAEDAESTQRALRNWIRTGGAIEDRAAREVIDLARSRAQRSVDLFQIALTKSWRRALTSTTLIVSGILGIGLALGFPGPGATVFTISAMFVGAFFSWVIRDISAGLERWRER